MFPVSYLRLISFVSSLGLVLPLRGRRRHEPQGGYTTTFKVGQDKAYIVYEFFQGAPEQLMVTLGVTCNDDNSITDRDYSVKAISEEEYKIDFGDELGGFKNDVADKCRFLKLKPDDFISIRYSHPSAIQVQIQGKATFLYSPQMEADMSQVGIV